MDSQPLMLQFFGSTTHSRGKDTDMYRVDGVDVAQETERNKATAKYVALPNCAWLLLSFFLLPVQHTLHPLCTKMPPEVPIGRI